MSATESPRSPQGTLRLRVLLRLQRVERALDLCQPGVGEVDVDGGGVEALVAEQGLDHAQVGAALDEVGGEGVAWRNERGVTRFCTPARSRAARNARWMLVASMGWPGCLPSSR